MEDRGASTKQHQPGPTPQPYKVKAGVRAGANAKPTGPTKEEVIYPHWSLVDYREEL